MSNYNPLISAFTRVFLIRGRAAANRTPSYEGCMKMAGLERDYGDVEGVECPDPDRLGEFIETARIRGKKERATTSLIARYAANIRSVLLQMADQRCAADVQLHIGACQNPKEFNSFDKVLILEDALITSHKTDDLGALDNGENGKVDETADISALEAYEIVPISFAKKADDLVTKEIVDAVICDAVSCGDCEGFSTGCNKLYAITKTANGSPSQPADIVFSIDAGENWFAHDIDGLSTKDPNAIGCFGAYVVVVSNTDKALHYVLKSELNGLVDPAWTRVTTGFVAGPNELFVADSAWMVIVGDSGYVYLCEDATAGVSVLDAGSATTSNLLAVDGLDRNFVVAVGRDGAIVMTSNGTAWATAPSSPVGIGVHLNTVAVKSKTEWFVGASNGNLYYTMDGGVSWTVKAFSGSGTGSVLFVEIATASVMYLSHQTAATKGKLLRSIDGGNSWYQLPEAIGVSIPAADKYNVVVACEDDPNFIFAGGLADDGSDGILLVGTGV